MSNVPTGITAYRNPETGEIAGSYQPNKVMVHLTADGVNRLGDTIYELRMEVERWKKAAEANIEENVQLRLLISDMEAARDFALKENMRLRNENFALRQLAKPETRRVVAESMQKLGARLAELLDEDQWAECEGLLLAAGAVLISGESNGHC